MTEQTRQKQSLLDRLLMQLEVAGNKLPDPVTLFVIISVVIVVLSAILAHFDISVINPANNKEVKAVSLLTLQGAQQMISNVVANFQGFPPLGLVLSAMVGIGVAEKTGLMEAAMRQSIAKISPAYVTLLIIFIGIISNFTADAGLVILPPLAASIYYTIGRHPLAGLFTAYAATAGAFHANILINITDVLEAGFTLPAAHLVDPSYEASAAMNYYFIIASTVVLLIAGYFMSVKFVEPRLGKYEAPTDVDLSVEYEDTPEVRKGLKWAGISVLIYVIALVALTIGPNALLRDQATGSLISMKAPLMAGIVPIVLVMFLIPGVVYGIITGSIKNDRDIVKMMNATMSGMGGYIIIAFFASQFLAYFKWSNMGLIIAIKGADMLQQAGIVGVGLIVAFILLSGFINLFIGSASAKWAIMAPVFVPMLLLLGYDPAFTQMAYRIGDSITNPISPLFPYFPIIIAFAAKYQPKVGMGTIIANMIPFSVVFGIVWTILLLVFMMGNIPLGPDGFIYRSL